jgi:hypothetical protein
MTRRLEDLARRRRGDVKTHADRIHGGPVLPAEEMPLPQSLEAIDAQLDQEAAREATEKAAQEALTTLALEHGAAPAHVSGPAAPAH